MLGNDPIMPMLASAKPEAAKAFYCGILGLQLVEDSMFALVFAAGAATLRIQKVAEMAPAPHIVLAWIVPDIVARIRELSAANVRFERFEGLRQDETGIWAAPNGDLVAWFRDPDGNLLSITKFG